MRSSPGGLIGVPTARRLGHSAWQLGDWARRELLERLLPGWYRIAGDPAPRNQAAVLAHRYLQGRQRNCSSVEPALPSCIVTGAQALVEHGHDPSEMPSHVTALVDRRRRVRVDPAVLQVVRVDMSTALWVPSRDGPHLLAPSERALVDWAADTRVSDAQIREAVDGLRHARALQLPHGAQAWDPRGGPGAARLSAMYHAGVFDLESEAERRLLRDVLALHPPLPDCQVWLTPSIRVDFAYLFAGVVLEYHGEDAHRDQVDHDATRAHAITRLHHEVIIITRSMTRDRRALGRWISDRVHRRHEAIRRGHLPRPSPPLDRPRRLPLQTLC